MERAEFVKRYPSLWHTAPLGAWSAIKEVGLLTASQLIEGSTLSDHQKRRLQVEPRRREVIVTVGGRRAILRDQGRLLVRRDLQSLFGDGLTLEDWILTLNCRVYLFGRERDMLPLLEKYSRRAGQDVIKMSSEALLERRASDVELADQNTGAVARKPSPQKFRDTFRSIGDFDSSRPVREITVVGGVSDIAPCVESITRHYPDGLIEKVS